VTAFQARQRKGRGILLSDPDPLARRSGRLHRPFPGEEVEEHQRRELSPEEDQEGNQAGTPLGKSATRHLWQRVRSLGGREPNRSLSPPYTPHLKARGAVARW